MMKQKKKFAILFILNLILSFGIYFAAVKLRFLFITPVYMAATVMLAVFYFILAIKNGKDKLKSEKSRLSNEETEKIKNRELKMKYILVIFTPILFTVLADYMLIITGMAEKLFG